MDSILRASSLLRGDSTHPPIYSVEINDDPEVAGEGRPRVNAAAVRAKSLPITSATSITSLYRNFDHAVQTAGDRPFLGSRPVTNGVAGPFIWLTYREGKQRVVNFGSGLSRLLDGIEEPVERHVGLFSANRPEWIIADQACHMYNLVSIPLLDMIGKESLIYVLNETEMPVIVTAADKAKMLLALISEKKLPHLKHIVLMDGVVDYEVQAMSLGLNVSVKTFRELESEGDRNPRAPVEPRQDSVATICYTSGTTGVPKGALLTQENMLSLMKGVFLLEKLGRFCGLRNTDVYISYLPLAHVFERTMINCLIHAGASVGFYQGDTLILMDDVSELRPTIFPGVPRLYNRIYEKVMSASTTGTLMGERIFNLAYKTKQVNLKDGVVDHALWDSIVFSGIRQRLGGRVRMMLTGAAPISKNVLDFLRICFSAQVYEGYGLTETCSSLTVTDGLDFSAGNVGVPVPGLEVKLVDIPAMRVSSNDLPNPRGEICVRGASVFKGYYKNPEETVAVLDAQGWFHTGDIGMWDSEGRLSIIDRKKSIFKLSQAEYIAPEKIETILCLHPLVAQAFVYGDSLKSCIVAVIVPERISILGWATRTQSAHNKSLQDICQDTDIQKAIVKELEQHGRANGLKGYEIVKAVYLHPVEFSVENGLLTPVMKLKRFQAREHFKGQIEAMYAGLR